MSIEKLQSCIEQIEQAPDFKLLRRVPELLPEKPECSGKPYQMAIIDLETTGLNPAEHEIIEIGTLIVSFTNESGLGQVQLADNQLQEPKIPIPAEITRITGITNEDVKGQSIDWAHLGEALEKVNLVVCHNASFDRQFLELATPSAFREIIEQKAFGCSLKDVDWRAKGYESGKLEYLNFKMGYFYEGHRALTDCWATLNVLVQGEDAFDDLKASVREKSILICAVGSDFDKKDLLKERGYRWSSGDGDIPKCWWTTVSEETYEEELEFLYRDIYYGREVSLPTKKITAFQRYSTREFKL